MNSLVGLTFNSLTVIKSVGWKGKNVLWLCRCDCGKTTKTIGPKLKVGHTKSCGCIKGHFVAHGEARKGHQTVEYWAWNGMKKRCYRENSSEYPYYGGRGIVVCDKWLSSYEAFLGDMGRRPSSDHSLDRIDNEGNYEPSNCRWATRSQQNKNRRSFKRKIGDK